MRNLFSILQKDSIIQPKGKVQSVDTEGFSGFIVDFNMSPVEDHFSFLGRKLHGHAGNEPADGRISVRS
jgi:hypothetical protein